jgi:hypothetical protein
VKVFILFLFVAFFLGGSRRLDHVLRRPVLLLGGCIIVAASFYSMRVLQ